LIDPWLTVGYEQTNAEGYGAFASCVYTGYDDLAANPDLLLGHAFIVHNEDGSRASCGIIEKDAAYGEKPLMTDLVPIPGTPLATNTTSSAQARSADTMSVGSVSVMSDLDESVPDGVCYLGYATNLEANVQSFLTKDGSDQCSATNGCGAHIHSGTGCEDTEVQGGHYYDETTIAVDPWLLESYLTTDSTGQAALVGCVLTGDGATEYDTKPFIVHGVDGGRLFCGLLGEEGSGGEETGADEGGESGASTTTVGSIVAIAVAISSSLLLAFV